MNAPAGTSASIDQPTYWWYKARAELLRAALGPHLGQPSRVLDVGSADGPSVGWMHEHGRRFALDVDPRGLAAGTGVCASALALPFADGTFDVVGAFDVLEHCDPEEQAMAELTRVLRPGGRLLMSVPAYEWAWSDHDVWAGHYRRYTRRRLLAAVEREELRVLRCTYGFSSVFPMFVAERLMRRMREKRRGPATSRPPLTQPSRAIEKMLMSATAAEQRYLRKRSAPFGSSIFLAAEKPR